jgi:uncharacterized protein YktA (UPF0223 family)
VTSYQALYFLHVKNVTASIRCVVSCIPNCTQMAGRRADWNSDNTKIFLELCIAEKEKFNYVGNKGLTKHGWQNVYQTFNAITGCNLDRKQLQNKFNGLKRMYKVWRKLKAASGSGWDSRTGTIIMDDDWWADQIQVNKCTIVVVT